MFLPQLFLLTVLAAMLSSRLRTPSPSSPGGIGRPRPPVGCVGESRSVGGIGFRAAPTQKESPPPSAVETDVGYGTSEYGHQNSEICIMNLLEKHNGPRANAGALPNFFSATLETDAEFGTSEHGYQNSGICIMNLLQNHNGPRANAGALGKIFWQVIIVIFLIPQLFLVV